jgi:predicted Fe-Mo cluster-binding NifX family protein/quercetin dioxygenase-like cupin family protein
MVDTTRLEHLGKDLAESAVQPFVVTLEPGSGSGQNLIVHTGHEFVYCLSGQVEYFIEDETYLLASGDSLVFESHLPHRWQNSSDVPSQVILVLIPSDMRDTPAERHFPLEDPNLRRRNMKIALITDDGKTISQHFGRAPYYLVLTIEEGKITNREMRDKMGHNQFSTQPHTEEPNATGHGLDSASHDKHLSMAEAIADCKVLLCGGMGRGAYESMRRLNIQPVVTDLRDVEAAAQAFIDGKLIDHTELLH